MNQIVKGKYKPTRRKIEALKESCENTNCMDIRRYWKCEDCRISNAFKEFTGLRLEEAL